MLQREMGHTLMEFIFQDLLCCYGAIAELITDNGTPYIAALDELKTKYSFFFFFYIINLYSSVL